MDIRGFLAGVRRIVDRHSLGSSGAYCRFTRDENGHAVKGEVNAYGCADAANILYTIGEFPANLADRANWISALQDLQYPSTGLFPEGSHHIVHTTAHCVAALELFDARPRHRVADLELYKDPAEMEKVLESLDWEGRPWEESHKGAGLYAALVLTGGVSREWEDHYFGWLYENTDPETGFPRKGCMIPVAAGGTKSIFPHLAGAFHYFFNHEYARRPMRYPKAVVDSCLDIYSNERFPPLGKQVHFAEIDWVYCLTRALRQSGHRFEECHEALGTFAQDYIAFLRGLDPENDPAMDDIHLLFGVVCCLAELQAVLPGRITTDRPLKLVLDRRPFI
jgi:hypothetical protein